MQESHSAHPYEVPHRIDDPVFDNLATVNHTVNINHIVWS